MLGVPSGSLSMASTFNECLIAFEYIQISRHFREDFDRCQLKLDVARARLNRWGEAMDINNNPIFQGENVNDEPVKSAREVLEEILLLFEAARRASKRHEKTVSQSPKKGSLGRPSMLFFSNSDLNPTTRRLDESMKVGNSFLEILRRNTLVQRTTWALWDAKSLERLVSQITGFVDDLEKLFPSAKQHQEALIEQQLNDAHDPRSLSMLRDAAEDTDELLAQNVRAKMKHCGYNYIRTVQSHGQTQLHVGNQYAEDFFVATNLGLEDKTINEVGILTSDGSSCIQVGQRYGSNRVQTG